MDTQIERVKVGRCWYDLHLDYTPGNEWPWFVNAYRTRQRTRGFRAPVRFVAGKTREDAIERVTNWIGANL